MAFEDLKVGVALILQEIEKRPEDHHVLLQELQSKIAEFHALGLPVPDDILRLEDQLEQEDADDMFDNMPI